MEQKSIEAVEASLTTAMRTHTCGELRLADEGKTVTLCGWVQTARDMNHFAFVDVRDRYGITQALFPNEEGASEEIKVRVSVSLSLSNDGFASLVPLPPSRRGTRPPRRWGASS